MANILFVDDEMHFSEMVAEYLNEKGFKVTLKHTAADGLAAFKDGAFDCCILDVRMPVRDGFSLAEDIRSLDEMVPILFLTGQTGKADRIKGLTIGADDYVTKPFSMEELFLRIKAILKRVGFKKEPELKEYQIDNLSFNPISRELIVEGLTTKLSSIESKLLLLFLENKNDLVKRDFLLSEIWKDDDQLKSSSLNVYMTKLRSLLKPVSNIEILSVHGEGYRMIVKS